MTTGAALPPPQDATRRLFAGLADDYERHASWLSFGQDPRWKTALVAQMPVGSSARVLDVATGTGAVAARLVEARGCRVTGIDASPDMLARARERLAAGGLDDRIELIEGDARSLPFPDASFDGLTVTYLLRYVDDPAATIRELVRVLKPGAPLVSLEFGIPPRAPAKWAWRAYVGFGLPAAGSLAGPGWREAGRFLARSIPEFYDRHPEPALLDTYAGAGLEGVTLRRMSLGGGILIWGRRPAAGTKG